MSTQEQVKEDAPETRFADRSFPSRVAYSLGDREIAWAKTCAGKIIESEPAIAAEAAFFQPKVRSGLAPGPSLLLEDHSGIRLFGTPADEFYSYRARLLAGDGDGVVLAIPRDPSFESYCTDVLGLGSVSIFALEAPTTNTRLLQPLACRCAEDRNVLKKVQAWARCADCINLVPYMGTGGSWHLAMAMAEICAMPVSVAAPTPRLARAANDKAWFTKIVAELFGRGAEPESSAAYGLAVLAAGLKDMTARHEHVCVKLIDSASSAGNLVFDATELGGLALSEIRDRLFSALRMAGWDKSYPLLLCDWEGPVLASPSAQLWIPEKDEGLPRIEGLFEQELLGPNAAFCGARPTRLSVAWQERLAREAALLGLLFQEMGYFGRCSLDSILVGAEEDDATLHWIECNGRWGGTSIPMTLADRLLGDWQGAAIGVMDRGDIRCEPRPFSEFLSVFKEQLYSCNDDRLGAVVLSPSRLSLGRGYEFLVIGRDEQDLEDRMRRLSAGMESYAQH